MPTDTEIGLDLKLSHVEHRCYGHESECQLACYGRWLEVSKLLKDSGYPSQTCLKYKEVADPGKMSI